MNSHYNIIFEDEYTFVYEGTFKKHRLGNASHSEEYICESTDGKLYSQYGVVILDSSYRTYHKPIKITKEIYESLTQNSMKIEVLKNLFRTTSKSIKKNIVSMNELSL